MSKVTIDRELLERILPVLDKAAFYKFGDPVTPDSKVANDLRTELLAILAQPTQQGEAVEVVGIRISTDGFGSYIADSAMGIGAAMPGEVHEPLMTVAQHQRILAASVPAGCKVVLPEPDFALDGGSTPCYYAETIRALLASAEGVKDE